MRGITKSFGDLRVLSGADLFAPEGKTIALLGPSGCGKTTLLRVIAGLEGVEGGTVALGGRVLTGPGVAMPPERRRIGMVFQDWALFPHMTVEQNVAYGLPKPERSSGRVEETLEMVGLSGLSHRMPSTLSGGQQQRVAIARAIAPRPAAMLLDEPFSNLDADLRVKVRGDIHRLLQELGITTVFVTHDQEEAFVLGDEVAVMRDGIIRQQAEPAELYARPTDPWVAGFVGDANLLDGDATGRIAWTTVGEVPLESEFHGSCRVLVRPEQLRIEPGDDGEVMVVEFYGHDTTYRVDVGDREIMVRAMAAPAFRRGDRVRLFYGGPATLAFREQMPSEVPLGA